MQAEVRTIILKIQGIPKIDSKVSEAMREAWESLPHSPQKEPALLTFGLDF
jgi:hypothetical protein